MKLLEDEGAVASAHRDGVWTVSPILTSQQAGPHFLSGGMDGVVRLWRLAVTGQREAAGDAWPHDLDRAGTMQKPHTLAVVSTSVSPNGKFAASSSLDGYLAVWDLQSRARLRKMDANFVEGWSTAFSPDSKYIAATSQHARVLVYSTEDGSRQGSYYTIDKEHKAEARMAMSVAFNQDGTKVVAGSSDGTVRLFDIESKKMVLKAPQHSNMVRALMFLPGAPTTMVTASDDHAIHWHDTREKNSVVAKLRDHLGIVTSLTGRQDGSMIASGSGDATVKLWDTTTRRCISTSPKRPDVIWDVAFCDTDKRLISACDNGTLYFNRASPSGS